LPNGTGGIAGIAAIKQAEAILSGRRERLWR
jgi:hypothetical protein